MSDWTEMWADDGEDRLKGSIMIPPEPNLRDLFDSGVGYASQAPVVGPGIALAGAVGGGLYDQFFGEPSPEVLAQGGVSEGPGVEEMVPWGTVAKAGKLAALGAISKVGGSVFGQTSEIAANAAKRIVEPIVGVADDAVKFSMRSPTESEQLFRMMQEMASVGDPYREAKIAAIERLLKLQGIK